MILHQLLVLSLPDQSVVYAASDFTEFSLPADSVRGAPIKITAGPDGNLWFTEHHRNKIGRITPAGVITEFPLPTYDSRPYDITAGPDGNLWFTELYDNRIGRITPGGVVTEFPLPTNSSPSFGITAGPDGNLWFTEYNANQIGRITPAGVVTEFPLPTNSNPREGITAGPDGNLWFTGSRDTIGRITPGGVITEFPLPTYNNGPFGITAGPDGNLWFTENDSDKIGRITPAGVVTEFPLPTTSSYPNDITAGPDGNLWFTYNVANNKIGRITPAGVITEILLPTVGSQPYGITAGPDGNLWLAEQWVDRIGRCSPAGCAADPGSTPTPQPTPSPLPSSSPSNPYHYVAMGDSYSSGEGGPPFIPPSGENGCHRAQQGYGPLLSHALNYGDRFSFVACSGAKIKNLFFGQNAELGQIHALGHTVDLVTLSIGGNDVGFVPVVGTCAITNACYVWTDGPVRRATKRIGRSGSSQPIDPLNVSDEKLSPDDPRFTLDRTFAGIRDRISPYGRVVVHGYSRFFPESLEDKPLWCNGITPDEQAWINSVVRHTNHTIAVSALRMGMEYVDMYNAFEGQELCSDVPWLHGLSTDDYKHSFHPNALGQGEFFRRMLQRLTRNTSYIAAMGDEPIEHVSTHTIAPQQTITTTASVNLGMEQVSFSSRWTGKDVAMSVTSPSGRTIVRGAVDHDVQHVQGLTYEVLTVFTPEPGTWTVNFYAAAVTSAGEIVHLTTTSVPYFHVPPEANFVSTPTEGSAPLMVHFDASSSIASDGSLTTYKWDFGDGTTGTGANVSHTYTERGKYQVSLTVIDDMGSQGFAGDYVISGYQNFFPTVTRLHGIGW